MSGMSEIGACPSSPTTDDPQLYHLPPPSPPPVSNSSWLLTRCQLLYCTTVLFKILYCNIKNVLFVVLTFLCIICVKSIINLLQYRTIELIVLVGYLHWVCWLVSCSVLSDSLWRYGLWPARLLCPWYFSGKNTGVNLWDLWTNWAYKLTFRMELVCMWRTYCVQSSGSL